MGLLRTLAAATLVGVLAAGSSGVAQAADDEASGVVITAYVDGRQIPPSEVSRYYCDDFSYPVIRCSTSAQVTDVRATLIYLLTAVDYVTVFDNTTYQGSFMHVSQDYASLLLIGWNDKIGSFKGRNSETGRFWTDWFNSGTSWSFCCNTNVSSLGAYNNTFSSMHRT